MSSFLETFLLLAEEAPPVKQAEGNLAELIFPIVALMFLWYFILIRPQKKEQAKRDDFLNTLKKNDKVITIGGIIGTVVNLSDEEVTIRVDDNTRIKMLRSSIQTIRTEESKQESK